MLSWRYCPVLPTCTGLAAARAGKKVMWPTRSAGDVAASCSCDAVVNHDATLFAIDSEHNAIPCLPFSHKRSPSLMVLKVLLTAGRPFSAPPVDTLDSGDAETGDRPSEMGMGRKISVDSAP